MKDRIVEKLLYKIAVLLVICGAFIRFLELSENYLGLYLILAGHVLGVVGIFMYMGYVNNMEQKQEAIKRSARQLEKS